MKLTRTSILSGETRTKDIDVTPEQLERWSNGEDIDLVMNNISKLDKEFITTGTTEKEWQSFCPDKE